MRIQMLTVRLDAKLENYLESRKKSKSEYVRDLIKEDKKQNESIAPAEEYAKCSEDLIYFAENYCYHRTPETGKKLFNPHPFQREILRELESEKWLLIVKSRQIGITLTLAIYSLWKVLFHDDTTVAHRSFKKKSSDTFLNERIGYIYNELPDWMVKPKLIDKRFTKNFQNNSKLTHISQKSHKGEKYDIAIFDEASFIKNLDSLWKRVNMQIEGQFVMTTNGILKDQDNYKLLKRLYKSNQFENLEFSYLDHPNRDKSYRDETISNGVMTCEKFIEEHGGLIEVPNE